MAIARHVSIRDEDRELDALLKGLQRGVRPTVEDGLWLIDMARGYKRALTQVQQRLLDAQVEEENDQNLSQGCVVAPGQVAAKVVSMRADEDGALAWREQA